MSEDKLVPIKARIKNFQSIADLEIEVRGFTCITGPTNIGKSAIVRALAYSALNKPVGGLVRSGSKFCSVEVSSSAGWSYLWEKGDRGVNRYTIDGKVYDKTGQSQLPELAQLGFTSVEVGKSELHPWWATQFSPVFLLDETGSSVTDFISKVSRLAVLQDAIVLSSRGKKSSAESAKDCAERSAKDKEKLSRVAAVDSLVRLRDDLVEQAKSIREYEAAISSLERTSARVSSLEARISAISGVGTVKVPKAPAAEPLQELLTIHGLWVRLEGAAKRVIALKGVSRAAVPGLPEAELAEYRAAAKYARLPSVAASVSRLAAAESVSVPKAPYPIDQVTKLRQAASRAARLGSLRRSVEALSVPVAVPAAPDGMEEVRAAVLLRQRRQLLESELTGLAAEHAGTSEAIRQADARLAAFPKCVSCGRVGTAGHAHA